MDENYLAFGGTEVINTERLQAYVDNGLVPIGTTVTAHPTCTGIQELLPGQQVPYRTPLLDQPPWYDAEDPDTWDFAGVLPLDITGLDGTTATVGIAESLNGGGVAGARIRGPRTVAVSALLVGRTTASVQAGLRWLTTALLRTCVDDDTCGSGAMLQGFTACPGPVCRTADTDAAPLVIQLQNANDPLWYVRSGTFTANHLAPVTTDDLYHDGGTPPSTGATTDDSGGPTATVEPEGGLGPVLPGDVIAPGILGGTQFPALAGPVRISWYLSTPAADVDVQLVLLDEVGEVADPGVTFTAPAGITSVGHLDFPDGVDLELWRAGLIVNDPGGITVTILRVEYQPQLTAAQCAAAYERVLPRVTTVSGPTPVEVVANGDCGDFLRVEWTWVVGSPYRYGHTSPLALNTRPLGGSTQSTATDYEAPGVSSDWHTLDATARLVYECVPTPPPAACYQDPCSPGFTAAPTAPVIPDPDRITADSHGVTDTVLRLDDITVCLDAPAVPGNENVLTISLRNDTKPKVGVRVRVYDAVEPDCVETSPCDFAYEFNIGYIPPSGVLTIDGVAGTVTTLCQGTLQDSSSVVSGSYGGARVDPVVKCAGRYLVHVQWLHIYPRTCYVGDTTAYGAGLVQGVLGVDLSVTPREG